MTKRAQSGLSRANYDLGGSRFDAKRMKQPDRLKKQAKLFTRREFELVGHSDQLH
jgi:hypothetical protein